ncbi:MAG TPA: hypothetical protein VHX65_04085 [Pirellulales bacterium]|nr:hypothetical protein [Pirellulales bacterium]
MNDEFKHRSRTAFLILCAIAIVCQPAIQQRAAAKEVEEQYPAGQTHLTYSVKNGLREGPLTEFYENGAPKVKAFYKDNLLTGKYATFYRNGKPQLTAAYHAGKLQGKLTEFDKLGHLQREATYRDGLLNGPEILYEDELPLWQVKWVDGQAAKINGLPVYPRSQDELWHSLQAIARGESATRSMGGKTTSAAASASDTDRLLAVRRLNAYRYLAELPADVGIDAAQNAAAELAAKSAVDSGTAAQPPTESANPGLSAARNDAVRKAIANCSIFSGRERMPDAIDEFLRGSTTETSGGFDDRRWCLNPAMRTIGMSRSGDVVALFSHDDRRKIGADWQPALFPCRGFMPVEFFSADQPWMALINPGRITLDPKKFDVIVRPIDNDAHPGKPLKIVDRRVLTSPQGLPTALVFKPAGAEVAAGRHYWVEIWGLKASGGAAYPLQYLVDFISVHPEDGAALALEGVPSYPRTLDDLRRGLQAIYTTVPPPFAPAASNAAASQPKSAATIDPAADADAVAAVRRLNAYRFVCGLPANVTLDAEQTYYAQAGAKLLKAVGKLDHTPANPGLPEAEYKDGYNGTSHSNIYQGSPNTPLASTVDAYMNDSDPSNIDRVGHRRWCLNPAMQTTGFGKYEGFSAMWSFDNRRPNAGAWDIVAYPARGYMPVEYFSPDHAWSLIWNSAHVKLVAKDAEISIRRLDDALHPGEHLELAYKNVETSGFGGGPAVIFKPKSLDMTPGRRYGVELKGATDPAGKPLAIRYLVEFVDLGGRPAANRK